MRSYAFLSLLVAVASATDHIVQPPAAPAHEAAPSAVPQPAHEAAPPVQTPPAHVAPPPAAHEVSPPAHAAPSPPVQVVASEVAPPAGAMTHTVIVGGVKPPAEATGAPTPMLLYTPESIKANVGDVVEFNFMQANHSATQSTFDKPCVKMANGLDSELKPNPEGRAGVTWAMTVPTMEPIWMYCKQRTGNHCGKGMVFSINAVESGDKSFAAFKQLAIAQNGTENLSQAPLQATPPAAPPAASTVTISAEGGQATAVAPGAAATPTVAPGNGQAADGSACSCSCLCGANSFPPQAAVNNFGGFAGMMSV